MSSQYGELRPTNGWDRFGSLGHPGYFQRLPRLGSVTARQSSSERQPNFAELNRGRHLCSARRPSRWVLAHISSLHCVCTQMRENPAKENNLAAFTETMSNIFSFFLENYFSDPSYKLNSWQNGYWRHSTHCISLLTEKWKQQADWETKTQMQLWDWMEISRSTSMSN